MIREKIYQPQKIEIKWQKIWQKSKAHRVDEKTRNFFGLRNKLKFYCLDMFPYPSAEGLHVGHMRGYTYSDVIARKKKMEGYQVLHPMGWDAFGLPAENYALKHNLHPKKSTDKNISQIKKQLESAGYMYDWEREINSSGPDYYKWTQWLFLQLYKKKLAYRKDAFVNWCSVCQTVLANEQIIEGKCERCESKVTKRNLKQWFFKITEYADRLLNGLDNLDWPDKVEIMQRNWIGQSYGTEFLMDIMHGEGHIMTANDLKEITLAQAETEFPGEVIKLRIYTTRIDTIFGMTYVVLAPEHPLIPSLVTHKYEKEVNEYLEKAFVKSEIERSSEEKEKTGVFTGSYAINPLNNQKIPIWIADYVLPHYGTGAIMAVPAHDERDYAFAEKYGLEIVEVVKPESGISSLDKGAFVEDGILVDSGKFSRLPSGLAREKITQWLEEEGSGFGTKKYKLRDWLISRQRYWGTPIPIIYCEKCGEVPVPESSLPVRLPENIEDFSPTPDGRSPLAKVKEFVETNCPICGKEAERETDTMDTFVDSSWYFLRYADSKNSQYIFDKKKIKKWLPVDLYIGGIEHAILHLLYSRFITKVLFDLGLIEFEEPFIRLFNQGMIYYKGAKMSKSKGNVVSPDESFALYGADAMRLYELFMGPPSQDVEWSDQGVIGVYRFLNKVWKLIEKFLLKTKNQKIEIKKSQNLKEKDQIKQLERLRHKTIKKVTKDIDDFRFNTAVSTLMEYTNQLTGCSINFLDKKHSETLLLLLAPMAPHLVEELWQRLGNKGSIFQRKWPRFNSDLVIEKEVEMIIQINGKMRDKLRAAETISEAETKELALTRTKIQKYLKKKVIKKIIFIPGRLINFVIQEKK